MKLIIGRKYKGIDINGIWQLESIDEYRANFRLINSSCFTRAHMPLAQVDNEFELIKKKKQTNIFK
jgi:hypothetical protein